MIALIIRLQFLLQMTKEHLGFALLELHSFEKKKFGKKKKKKNKKKKN